MCVRAHVHSVGVNVEELPQEQTVPCSHHVGARIQTQVVRIDGECLYPPTHLSGH